MKALKPDDEALLNALQHNAQSRPSKLPADQRAQLHRALESSPGTRPRSLGFALLASTLTLCLMLLLSRQTTHSRLPPATIVITTPEATEPATSLDWKTPDNFSTRIARAQASRKGRFQSFKPKSMNFKSRTNHLKSKLQMLRKDLS